MNNHKTHNKRSRMDFLFETNQQEWKLLSLYERFEQVVAITITMVISLVIVFALFALVEEVLTGLILGSLDPRDHSTFKQIFGMIMAVLIAMEFKHSIIKVAGRRESIIRVNTVILITLLALARKLIIIDLNQTSPTLLAAIAVSILALGAVYWLLRGQDRESH
ncbi:MAG: phosphate-starvation-inducible PsiE family protein [Methylothermaceae bacterium]|nr:phosphate-starvation-inducible PsiE family protein [Methylothermaceae bacterium]